MAYSFPFPGVKTLTTNPFTTQEQVPPPPDQSLNYNPINPSFQPGGNASGGTTSGSPSTGSTPPRPTGFLNAVPPPPPSPTPQTATATSATGKSYSAAPYAVDPRTGTVQGQITALLDKGGAYLRRGATEGVQKAAERGLLNSSLSSGYAMGAMVDRALPIAQADAGFFDKAMTNTANALNAERQFNTQQANQIALENAKNQTQISALNAQEANKLMGLELDADTRYALGQLDANTRERLGKLDADTRYALGQLDAQTRERVASMDNDTRLLLQTNTSAADMYANTVRNIADITRDPSLNATAKQAAVDAQLNMLNQGIRQIQAVSSAGSPDQLQLGDFFTKKTQISRMNDQQVLDERARLQNAVRAAKTGTIQRKSAVDALNEFNSLVAEVRGAPNIAGLNLAEGF